jgi:energy-converting hydrogenase Eha subunit H
MGYVILQRFYYGLMALISTLDLQYTKAFLAVASGRLIIMSLRGISHSSTWMAGTR